MTELYLYFLRYVNNQAAWAENVRAVAGPAQKVEKNAKPVEISLTSNKNSARSAWYNNPTQFVYLRKKDRKRFRSFIAHLTTFAKQMSGRVPYGNFVNLGIDRNFSVNTAITL